MVLDHRQHEAVAAAATVVELHGDVLEAVVSRVPALDLLSTSLVSKDWHGAVLSSLCHSPRRVPWLLVHYLNPRRRAAVSRAMAVTTYAYDPLSRTWASVPGSPEPPASEALIHEPLRRAYPGARLYALNLRNLAVSDDPFGTSWQTEAPPQVWRTDPVVAVVGHRVVVAGGACEFEDEVRAVEVYRDGAGWQACESIPEAFGDSSSAAWLSVATSDERLYVMEKKTKGKEGGCASCFDPESGRWGPTQKLRLPGDVSPVAIGYAKDVDKLILLGVGGRSASAEPASVTLWAVDGKTLEMPEKMGRMPNEMAEELATDDKAVEFCCEWGFGYIYKKTPWSSTPKVFFAVEFGKVDDAGGKVWRCRWERVPAPAEILREELMLQTVVIACSSIRKGVELKTVAPPATAAGRVENFEKV